MPVGYYRNVPAASPGVGAHRTCGALGVHAARGFAETSLSRWRAGRRSSRVSLRRAISPRASALSKILPSVVRGLDRATMISELSDSGDG
jgi:hypothetical protein